MKIGAFSSLALRNEIINTNKTGQIIRSNALLVKFIQTDANKCAFIVKKKLGNSPARNKFKRRIREIIRKIEIFDEINIYCLIIAKGDALSYPFSRLKNELMKSFFKIHEQLK